MSVHIIGSFPHALYKGCDKEEYANLFLERGSFIMRPLSFFHEIEDTQRKDKGEGEGRVVIHMNRPVLTLDQKSGKTLSKTNEFGPVFFGTDSINPRYILCFSGPQVDVKHLASQYGGYVVCLSQPDKLVCDIASYLEQCPNMPDTMWLKCIQVRYDKDQLVSTLPEPASEERSEMSYRQKNPKFSSDYEYRLVLTLPLTANSLPPEIRVELHKRLGYAETVWPPVDNQNSPK
jgi:hypothetical protein